MQKKIMLTFNSDDFLILTDLSTQSPLGNIFKSVYLSNLINLIISNKYQLTLPYLKSNFNNELIPLEINDRFDINKEFMFFIKLLLRLNLIILIKDDVESDINYKNIFSLLKEEEFIDFDIIFIRAKDNYDIKNKASENKRISNQKQWKKNKEKV